VLTKKHQIFNDVCRKSSGAGDEVSFAAIESSMYKRRRTAMLALPNAPDASNAALAGTRYAVVGQLAFYRGQISVDAVFHRVAVCNGRSAADAAYNATHLLRLYLPRRSFPVRIITYLLSLYMWPNTSVRFALR